MRGLEAGQAGQTDAAERDEDEREGQQRRPDRPAPQVADPSGEEGRPRGCGPRGEGAPRDDEDEDPGPCRCPGRGVERRKTEQHDPCVADDRVAHDVLDIVLDPGGQRGQHDRGDRHGQDDRPRPADVDQQGRDRRIDPGQGDDREGRGGPARDERQLRLGDRIGQPGRPGMERDRPEPDGDGQGEGQVRQPEDRGLGSQRGQVAPDPGGRGDRHRARDDRRPEHPHADRGAGSAARRHQGQQGGHGTAGRRGEHREPRIRNGQRDGARGQDPEAHGCGVAARAGSRPDHGEAQRDDGAEEQELAEVRRDHQPRPADGPGVTGDEDRRGDDCANEGDRAGQRGDSLR